MFDALVWKLQKLSSLFSAVVSARNDSWENGETYLLIFLACVYGCLVLALFFGTLHCCAVLTGTEHQIAFLCAISDQWSITSANAVWYTCYAAHENCIDVSSLIQHYPSNVWC